MNVNIQNIYTFIYLILKKEHFLSKIERTFYIIRILNINTYHFLTIIFNLHISNLKIKNLKVGAS